METSLPRYPLYKLQMLSQHCVLQLCLLARPARDCSPYWSNLRLLGEGSIKNCFVLESLFKCVKLDLRKFPKILFYSDHLTGNLVTVTFAVQVRQKKRQPPLSHTSHNSLKTNSEVRSWSQPFSSLQLSHVERKWELVYYSCILLHHKSTTTAIPHLNLQLLSSVGPEYYEAATGDHETSVIIAVLKMWWCKCGSVLLSRPNSGAA